MQNELIAVHDDVLYAGMVFNVRHDENMPFILLVTLDVSNKGATSNALHPLNIACADSKVLVLFVNPVTFFNEKHMLNIFPMFVL